MGVRHCAKVGRPTSYNDKIAEKICSLIAEGNSLRSICKRNEMPDKATVMRWLGVHREFSDQYARARESQADKLFEECLEIADGAAIISRRKTMTARLSGRSITSTSNRHPQMDGRQARPQEIRGEGGTGDRRFRGRTGTDRHRGAACRRCDRGKITEAVTTPMTLLAMEHRAL